MMMFFGHHPQYKGKSHIKRISFFCKENLFLKKGSRRPSRGFSEYNKQKPSKEGFFRSIDYLESPAGTTAAETSATAKKATAATSGTAIE